MGVLCNGMDRRVGVMLAVVAAMCGGPVTSSAQNGSAAAPRPGPEMPVGQLKPDATVAMPLAAGAVADADAVWIARPDHKAIVRVDAKTHAPGPPVALDHAPCGSLASAFGSLWVPLCESHTVARVDPASGKVTASLPLSVAHPQGRLAVAVGSVWIPSDGKGVVTRVDPDSNTPVAETYVSPEPVAVAGSDDALWVTSEKDNTLARIDPHTNLIVETVKVGPRPGRVAVGEGAVWTLNRGDGTVSRVDPATNKVVETIVVGEDAAAGDIAAGEGSVWLSAPGVPLLRIDPRTNRVAQRFTGPGGGAVLVAHGSLWIAAGPDVTWRVDPKLAATMRPQ